MRYKTNNTACRWINDWEIVGISKEVAITSSETQGYSQRNPKRQNWKHSCVTWYYVAGSLKIQRCEEKYVDSVDSSTVTVSPVTLLRAVNRSHILIHMFRWCVIKVFNKRLGTIIIIFLTVQNWRCPQWTSSIVMSVSPRTNLYKLSGQSNGHRRHS